MAGILLGMILLSGSAIALNEHRKKRNITLPLPEKQFRELQKGLRKSKFFKESDAMKIATIIKRRLSGETEREEREKQKKIIKKITEKNSVPVSLPQAWCPNDKKTTCSLFDKDKYFPEDCVGDFNKLQCLDRINKYVADEDNVTSQIKDYCSRVNDVCVTYKNKKYATTRDRKICGDLISGCN